MTVSIVFFKEEIMFTSSSGRGEERVAWARRMSDLWPLFSSCHLEWHPGCSLLSAQTNAKTAVASSGQRGGKEGWGLSAVVALVVRG